MNTPTNKSKLAIFATMSESYPPLEILYQDEFIVAINKPHGLLVHPSPIARDAEVFALQLLRDQLGKYVHPAHRLDRKTSGVLLFSLDKETDPLLQKEFAENRVKKTYQAVVRGFSPESGTINYALTNDRGIVQEALTNYKTIDRYELNVPFGKHATSRYSLVEVYPQSGRMHQIRKHFAHIMHPIIGDRPHGCNKQNKLFKERWNMTTMLLHAKEVVFHHPRTNVPVKIKAPFQNEFIRAKKVLIDNLSSV